MHPFRPLLAAFALGALLAGCGRQSPPTQGSTPSPASSRPSPISIVDDPKAGERRAESRIGRCVGSLVYRSMEPYTLLYRNTCPQPLIEKVTLLGDEITALFGADGPPRELSSLYVGQLAETFPEIGERVVLGVADTSERKFRKAVEHGQINHFFAEHASDAENYPEMTELFLRWNFKVVGVSVEKVMVQPAEATPFRDKLLEEKVKPDRSLPYDAQTWFKLRHEDPSADEKE